MILDHLEYITIQKQVTDFPKHYHETFCISLIRKGIEKIELEEQSIYSEAESITITNPYEIHANPLIDADIEVSFDTIYIPKDIMKFFLNGKNIIFNHRKIRDKQANKVFINLKNAIAENNNQKVRPLLYQFVSILKIYSEQKKEDYLALNPKNLTEVGNYIDNHLTDKFSLDKLSKIAYLNKFSFVKKFKASVGISPMNYILMKKIFSAKKRITKNSILTQIAYDYNFSDMAHFSKTFKRYIGISPKVYQKNISLGTMNK